LREGEVDLALAARDRLDPHRDRVTETVCPPASAPGERRPGRVQLEELARQAPRGQESLEHLAEADKQARADHPGDLALPRLLPPTFLQPVLEQPGEAEVVGEVLDLGRLPLPGGGVLGQLGKVVRSMAGA